MTEAAPATDAVAPDQPAPRHDRHDRPKGNRDGDQRGGKPQGKPQRSDRAERPDGGAAKPYGKDQGAKPRDEGAKRYESRPARVDKVDPDNPFAVLMGLKIK